jgi:hypothetical protein
MTKVLPDWKKTKINEVSGLPTKRCHKTPGLEIAELVFYAGGFQKKVFITAAFSFSSWYQLVNKQLTMIER